MDETQPTTMLVDVNAAPPPLAWFHPPPQTWTPTYAGFWRRFFARSIDGFLVGIAGKILDGIVDYIIQENMFDSVVTLMWLAVNVVLFVLIDWLYYACQESSAHRATVGKRALGIVVTDLAGNRISFGRATGRYFAHIITFMTLGIGYLIQPFTKRRQALHDLIAGTLVVGS
jgi:uncharacterized RDD family membrane protein YckC